MKEYREGVGPLSEYEHCSAVCHEITNLYGGNKLVGDYPEDERNVLLVWTVTGIIENGGFEYLFSSTLPGDPNYGYTLNAFEALAVKSCIKQLTGR